MKRLEDLTPGQAHYVLGRVVSDKKIRSREIDKYLSEMDDEIKQLESRLSMLRDAQGSDDGAAEEAPTRPARKKRGRRKGRKKAASTAAADKPASKGAKRGRKAAKGRKSAGKSGKRASRKALTPEAQKSRQLQGQYISLIKRFSGKEKEKYRKLASEQGREEAIKQMRSASGG